MSGALETFFSAWGMSDADERRAAIASVISEDAVYADPRSSGGITGIEAVAAYVAMFSENAPGWEAHVVKSDETAGVTRATVSFGGKGPDGTEMIQHGQYFVEMNGDKLKKIVGFVGTGEPG